jgi:two-component system, cell cycle sensor histidine kinase and response regulator CckA
VAHDFNNMLSVIMGNAEFVLDKTAPDDPLHEDLKEILEAARRSTDITRQLLAFARRQTIAPEVIDLNETVEAMLKMLRRLIGEDIDFSWQPGPGRMPVLLDPSQLDQILANLCINARDAIDGVGNLTIETDHVCFDAEYCAEHAGFVPGDFIMLPVSDDGQGMDRDTLDKIFQPFFTTKEKGKGTGLGLSTVYGIVKQSNGNIWVYSEPGHGTTFKIYLPVAGMTVSEIGNPKKGETKDLFGSETVLVVEDDESLRKLAIKALEKYGYTVLTAADGREALRTCQEYKDPIHIMVTDVIMPGISGKDLANRLTDMMPDMKVLYMSGYTDNVIVHHGVLEKGIAFLQKPFTPEGLARKVREVIEKRKDEREMGSEFL